MNDSYKELLVKREMGLKGKLLRGVCIVPTVLLGLLTLLLGNVYLFIFVILLCVVDYFVFQSTDVEYEYLYLDKEINVDKVMAKTRRKKAASIDLGKLEIMAPEKSYQLDNYRKRECKVTDLSAGHDVEDMKVYWLYCEGNQKYILSLTEDFVNVVKKLSPRKVFDY